LIEPLFCHRPVRGLDRHQRQGPTRHRVGHRTRGRGVLLFRQVGRSAQEPRPPRRVEPVFDTPDVGLLAATGG
jgi:hypothetical protein